MKNVAKPYNLLFPSPLGMIGVRATGANIFSIDVDCSEAAQSDSTDPQTEEIAYAFERYFRSAHADFGLTVNPQGTEFQKRVWQALQQIPAGQVETYGSLAKRLGSSPRAVGNACRNNPVPIIIPCHRVVSAGGLGGYSGATSGKLLDIKKWLLRHEGVAV